MRVLLCALEAPDGTPNGLNLLVGGTLDALASRHDVRLLAFGARAGSAVAGTARLLPAPRRGGWRNGLAWLDGARRGRPWQVGAVERAMRGPLVEEIAAFGPDVVHVVSGRLAGLGAELDGRPSILTAIDAWHLNADAAAAASPTGPRQLARRVEARAVRRFEASAFSRFDRVAVLTRRDADALREVAPSLRPVVVPHGVDGSRYRPDPAAVREPRRIVLHGVMSYPPNVRAARVLVEEVLPLVRAEVPDAEVALVGRAPSKAVIELGSRPGVTVTGAVDDIGPWLTTAGVYACPMRDGGGVKNKVLEAMAVGAPCVATSVAVQGLGLPSDGTVAVLVEDDVRAFAAAVVRVLRDPALAHSLGERAARLVRDEHTWDAVGAAYTSLYEEVLAEAGARHG